ncbi:SDR family NAD(P)-dependent oxidoreductase [Streptomyces millisiae]|uniref:SDR family oxidoreductase n=1 Tax=Streptomyces millisiae TaxID=3075542 RepID=A0ABU2LMZ2_9ACTN|nr:SDR family oxidoreductase [Streptomyces sp. DSM 44918]MDT0318952.1 SDR family oxidoreductase [Streptomyces sp. DSM 44918]
MSEYPGLRNAAAVVTGGGSGIGRATALALAASGARVVVADLEGPAAERVRAAIESAGGTAVTVVGDLGDQAVVDAVIATAVTEFGTLDVLVNNAGVMDDLAATADVTDEAWERLLAVNLTAPFRLTRAALPVMLAQGRGAIVNTASEAALRGSAAGTAYTVSKWGLAGLTLSTAVMYRGTGIRVNAVAPGGTRTNISVTPGPGRGPEVFAAHAAAVGRVAEPEELAAAIVFLASDAASNINGVVLPVDNGWSAV